MTLQGVASRVPQGKEEEGREGGREVRGEKGRVKGWSRWVGVAGEEGERREGRELLGFIRPTREARRN